MTGRPMTEMTNTPRCLALQMMRAEIDDMERRLAERRGQLHEEIALALLDGEPTMAVARASGYTRQRIYQIGVELEAMEVAPS